MTLARGDLWGFFLKRTAETPIALIILVITIGILVAPSILSLRKKHAEKKQAQS